MAQVAVVHAVRRAGGAGHRLAQWRHLLGLAGFEVVEVPALAGAVLPRGWAKVPALVRGSVAAETVAWSTAAVRRSLAGRPLAGVVFLTLRAFDPALVPPGVPGVVDFVDQLSRSYRQRATIDGHRPVRLAWDVLAGAMRRAERQALAGPLPVVAAGHGEAGRLGVRWIPVTVGPEERQRGASVRRARPEHERWDVLFAGTLDYPPNVAALRALAESIWPSVLRRRPGTTLCVAGRRPGPEVRGLVRSLGAELVEDFPTFDEVAVRCRLAVAPLPVASGIQIKALQASACGMPLVVTPAVADGLDPGFPAAVAAVGPPFAARLLHLLDDPSAAAGLGAAAAAHVERCYASERWVSRVSELFQLPSAKGSST